jgi:hypothetical protein
MTAYINLQNFISAPQVELNNKKKERHSQQQISFFLKKVIKNGYTINVHSFSPKVKRNGRKISKNIKK